MGFRSDIGWAIGTVLIATCTFFVGHQKGSDEMKAYYYDLPLTVTDARNLPKGSPLPESAWTIKPLGDDSVCNQSQVTAGLPLVAMKVNERWLLATIGDDGEAAIVIDGTAIHCAFDFKIDLTNLQQGTTTPSGMSVESR